MAIATDTINDIIARSAGVITDLDTFNTAISNLPEPDTDNIESEFNSMVLTAQTAYSVTHSDGHGLGISASSVDIGGGSAPITITGGIVTISPTGDITISGGSVSINPTGTLTLKGTDWAIYKSKIDQNESDIATLQSSLITISNAAANNSSLISSLDSRVSALETPP